MNVPDQPLSPDTLDELLSADIDGEFDRAAVELGFAPDVARAAIAAAPDAVARRVALTRARDLLSTAPPLETERQSLLVASALSAIDHGRVTSSPEPVPLVRSRSRNARRVLVGVGAAAAVIAGIIAVAATNPGRESKSSATAKAGSKGAAGTTDVKHRATGASVTFGDVSQPRSLRAQVLLALPPTADAPQPQAATRVQSPVAAKAGTEVVNGSYDVNPSGTDLARRNRAAIQACITSIVNAAHLRSAPVLSGMGTFGARPVIVVVFRQATAHLVYVLAATDCTVIARDTVP